MTQSMMSMLFGALKMSEKKRYGFSQAPSQDPIEANPAVEKPTLKTKKTRRPTQKAAKSTTTSNRRGLSGAHITDREARNQAQSLVAMGGFPMPFLPWERMTIAPADRFKNWYDEVR
ncbi:hypothetical protein AK812_SmicGene22770 [Symbiodinium microadriaticum]|uniref:Uncharacterized protein n=1 Tax=Symbiodinium microadriaticum TaxID=2951 RepID=A0A1Q9DIY3_SYMMI|nr:hypothetical protein AK812_SmicGene22770 [Symbiodinium microadriaticum]